MAAICELYRTVGDLHAHGTYLVSMDERTGMQALERLHPTKYAIPGSIEREEFEYVRHGTLCLTANFDVLTGTIISPTIAETRGNETSSAMWSASCPSRRAPGGSWWRTTSTRTDPSSSCGG